jgi:polyhydroxyalkanoate synthesis regulator phasin
MLDLVRRYVEAGRDALSPQKAQDLARALVKQGEAGRDQASTVARQLLEWSRRNSERFRETVQREVRRQITRAGFATKDEVEGLRRRVRELERSSPSPKRTSSKSAGRRKTATRKTATRKKSTTRKAATRKSTSARPSAAPRPPSGGGSSSG